MGETKENKALVFCCDRLQINSSDHVLQSQQFSELGEKFSFNSFVGLNDRVFAECEHSAHLSQWSSLSSRGRSTSYPVYSLGTM